jgi:hypothetical protein
VWCCELDPEVYSLPLYWSVQFSGWPCSLKKVSPIPHYCTGLYNFLGCPVLLRKWALYLIVVLICTFLYPRSPKGEGGILFYLCSSVLLSIQDIFRRIFLNNCWWQKSDIWSQASYRYTILWVAFLDPSDSYFLFADLVGFYTHWTYMHIFRHIFLSNYWWQRFDIWSQASYRYPISWEAVLDPSDSYFLFAELVGFYTHWTYMHIFHHIFLSNYWWQKSDIWSQASYRYPILWEAFLDPSDSYFLFAEERGYHRWALAHSSSCSGWLCSLRKVRKVWRYICTKGEIRMKPCIK